MKPLDAHCHVWRLARGDYDWLTAGGAALSPIRRDFSVEEYPEATDLILVQAVPTRAETDFLLDIAAGDPRVVGVVGWVDLEHPDCAAEIETLARHPKFKGVRPMLQDIEATDWLIDHARPDAMASLVRNRLSFDALVTERHLPMLCDFASENRDLPLVVDHAAKPKPGPHPVWEEGMAALARLPHVHCKLSGLLTELTDPDRRDPLPALRSIFDQLLDWFGPERLIWGSDWPVLTLAASWHEWRNLTDLLLSGLSRSERTAIMRHNGARFYAVADQPIATSN